MQRALSKRSLSFVSLALLFAASTPPAQADPITIPGYTVTDLGAGTPTFSTGSGGNGFLTAPGGQMYAFQQTPDTTLMPRQGILANLPQLQQPPPGATFTTFSSVNSATMNASGMVLATNVDGTFGHEYTTTLFAIQHNADGTLGPALALYTGGGQFDMGNIGSGVSAMLSASNQVLIQDKTIENDNINLLLYNINTQTLTNISSLLLNLHYLQFEPTAIDDLGRIVLTAEKNDGTGQLLATNLLLTPDGMSASPLEAPVPEPGALAVMLVAAAGFAIHRIRERRRGT
jgi:hypothetical protein